MLDEKKSSFSVFVRFFVWQKINAAHLNEHHKKSEVIDMELND